MFLGPRTAIPSLVQAVCALLIATLASAQNQPPAAIRGTVADASGSAVAGALVTLHTAAVPRTTLTGDSGAFLFSAVDPGTYTITISAGGFADWKSDNVTVRAGENPQLPPAVLQVAPTSTKVDVGLTPQELAVEQIKAEEKQRVLGVFPHYFVTYEPNPAPLNAAQKFQLGWKTLIDPVPFVTSGIAAGVEQARNSYHEFGQGTEGYAKRYGALYADRASGVLVGHVLLQSVFHQDPRYFYKGTGSFRSRFFYAFATAFVAKGDNGHWQPAYANVLGSTAAGEISTLYYPASSRVGLRIFHGVLLDFADRASSNLLEEFVLRKVTAHVPKTAAAAQPVLREGTPVSLLSVEDLGAKTPANAGPIDFVLAGDIRVEGAVVARAGSKASGQASYSNGPGGDPGATQVGLARVRLTIGNREIPLRSTATRGGAGALEYRRLENSGRIVIVLYVAQNVTLPPAP